MDAECRKRRRDSSLSLQENRWSMSSQRLEEIVAELMKPVSHHGQSFDRDDAGLLEEYLTAAGLRLLEAGEGEGDGEEQAPNYAEIGLLLQSYVSNYSRKVDHLLKEATNFSSELSAGVDSQESPAPEAEAEGPARRRRGAPAGPAGAGAFESIALAAAPPGHARRAGPPPGPPPALPRPYAELQPRAPRPDRELHAYLTAEPIGSLDDCRVCWRLQDGYLVEQLARSACDAPARASLAPLSLLELQEACARGAAGPPCPPAADTPPPAADTPPPAADTPPPPDAARTPPMPPPAALKRKRPAEVRLRDLSPGTLKFTIDAAAWPAAEFALSQRWIWRVVRHRRDAILRGRRALSPLADFRGFDTSWTDIGGFRGWAGAEGVEARAAARRLSAALQDSDDDGFFERRSVSMSPELAPTAAPGAAAAGAPLDLAALARDVRRALPAAPGAVAWRELYAGARAAQPQASRVLLDVLMKATRGEVRIEPGAPLSVGEFSVRVLSDRALGPDPADADWLSPPPRADPDPPV